MSKVNLVRWLKQIQGEWEAEQLGDAGFKRSDALFALKVLNETPANTYSEIKDLKKSRMPNPDTMKRMADGLDAWREGYGTMLYLMAGEQPPMPTKPRLRKMIQIFLKLDPNEQEEVIRDLIEKHPDIAKGEYQQAIFQTQT